MAKYECITHFSLSPCHLEKTEESSTSKSVRPYCFAADFTINDLPHPGRPCNRIPNTSVWSPSSGSISGIQIVATTGLRTVRSRAMSFRFGIPIPGLNSMASTASDKLAVFSSPVPAGSAVLVRDGPLPEEEGCPWAMPSNSWVCVRESWIVRRASLNQLM